MKRSLPTRPQGKERFTSPYLRISGLRLRTTCAETGPTSATVERRGYAVTGPPGPESAVTTAQPDHEDIYVYPTRGQSEDKQASDRYECYRWAADQTGFDPTQPLGGVAAGESAAKRDAYHRAETACLEARGYTVR